MMKLQKNYISYDLKTESLINKNINHYEKNRKRIFKGFVTEWKAIINDKVCNNNYFTIYQIVEANGEIKICTNSP